MVWKKEKKRNWRQKNDCRVNGFNRKRHSLRISFISRPTLQDTGEMIIDQGSEDEFRRQPRLIRRQEAEVGGLLRNDSRSPERQHPASTSSVNIQRQHPAQGWSRAESSLPGRLFGWPLIFQWLTLCTMPTILVVHAKMIPIKIPRLC